MNRIIEFFVGLLFGIGLLVSGMTDPGKVLGFLDLAGAWDPSLAFVMGGAILVGVIAFTVAKQRTQTFLGDAPAPTDLARHRPSSGGRICPVRRRLGSRRLLPRSRPGGDGCRRTQSRAVRRGDDGRHVRVRDHRSSRTPMTGWAMTAWLRGYYRGLAGG